MRKNKNIISFLNMKGGVGKTTLCKEMALFLSQKEGNKVLVIDIDPQSNCTQSFFERYDILSLDEGMIEESKKLPSINNIFMTQPSKLSDVCIKDIICELTANLHIIPGELETIFMERETASGAAEQKLLNFIAEHDLSNEYTYIFIDCPPTYSFYTISALLASSFYFVPIKPDAYSLLGLDLLERVVKDLKKAYRSNFEVKPINNLGVVFTMIGGTASTGYETNRKAIKDAYHNIPSNDIYFFNNDFPRYDKLSTGKLETFIIDRDDKKLYGEFSNLCYEFEERVRQCQQS